MDNKILVGHDNGRICTFDITGQDYKLHNVSHHDGECWGLEIIPEMKTFLTCGDDNEFHEFSFENNGESYQSTKVGYYVSTNDYISTVDTPLKTITMGLGRNTVYTYQTTITIPNTLNSGQNYWLGTIIDKDSTLSEVTETNNRTYLAIRVN